MAEPEIALQLYTVRDETGSDFAGTLRHVAEMGYAGVEFAGYDGLDSNAMAALMRETGLRAAGCHVSLEALQRDLVAQIDYCAAIGSPFLVLASLPEGRRDAGGIEKVAPFLDTVGLQCRDRGLGFAYHNHGFDFARLNGHTLLALLLERTDPGLVGLELDVYWAASMGVDPAGFLRDHAERIALVHLKDMAGDGEPADVGEGMLDMRGIISAARAAGVPWLIVEHDEPRGGSPESAQRSLENLRRLLT